MKTRSLLIKLSKSFPKRIAKKNHDFVGLMVGPLKEETNKVLVCLDFDEEILAQTLNYQPDLIITHHPFFYGSKTKILKHDEIKARLYQELLDAHIPLYSIHTNFDEGKGGMNDALSSLLELENVYAPEFDQMMRIGTLKNALPLDDFVKYAKDKLRVDYALLTANGKDTIQKVGIIGGGGSRSYKVAMLEGADIYISGDAPHHVRREVIANHYNYLDVPHEVERVFMPTMANIIKKMDPKMEVIILDHELMPKVII